MQEELMMTLKNSEFSSQLQAVLTEKASHTTILDNLKKLSVANETVNLMISKKLAMIEKCKGQILGLLKVYYDTLPPALAEQTKINGIPLGMLIKIKIDEEVLIPLENSRHHQAWINSYVTGNYQLDYQRFCSHISGYAYNFTFSEERFADAFPGTMKDLVAGFAEGYSLGLQQLAKEIDFPINETHPLEQDIWKNHQFFFTHDCDQYRLDGTYTFPFHEAYTNVPLWNKSAYREINVGLYELLQSRPVENFDRTVFNFDI